MGTLYTTYGLPGPGKNYLGEWLAARSGGKLVVLDRDSIREHLHLPPRGNTIQEGIVTTVLERRVRVWAGRGKNIWVANINLNMGHISRLEKIAREVGHNLVVVDFSEVPYFLCVDRNSRRWGGRRVPDDVMERMNSQIRRPCPWRGTVQNYSAF